MKELARSGLLEKIHADIGAGMTEEAIDAKYPARAD